MKTLGLGTVLALSMAVLACGRGTPDTSSTLKVTGSIDTQRQALDNASAVAIGSDGRTFSAYVQQTGRFTLQLPVGHVYRIIIANSTMSGELRPVGHLVNTTSRGKADVISVKESGSLNLGTLRPAGSSAGAVHTACDCTGGSSSDKSGDDKSGGDDNGKDSEEGGDDYKSHEKDSDKDRVCQGDADVELEADHAPGDKCAKDADEEDAPKPKAKSCSNDSGKNGKDDSKGGDDKSGGGYGDKGGGKSGGGSCSCTSQCASGSSCVASKCTPDTQANPGGASSSSGGTPPGPK